MATSPTIFRRHHPYHGTSCGSGDNSGRRSFVWFIPSSAFMVGACGLCRPRSSLFFRGVTLRMTSSTNVHVQTSFWGTTTYLCRRMDSLYFQFFNASYVNQKSSSCDAVPFVEFTMAESASARNDGVNPNTESGHWFIHLRGLNHRRC